MYSIVIPNCIAYTLCKVILDYWLYSLCFPLRHCKLLFSYLVVWTSWSPSPILPLFPYLFLLVTISLFPVSESVYVLLYSFVLFFRFTCKWKCAEFVFLWLISLSIIPSRSGHIASGKFSYLYGWIIFFCVYILHLIYPFICCWTLRLHLYLG